MKKKLFSLGTILLILFSLFLPATTSLAKNDLRIVTAEKLHIRTGPGLSYSIEAHLKAGDEVQVLRTAGDWLEIKFGKTQGYIASWMTTPKKQTKDTTQTVIAQIDGLNVRSGPSTDYSVVNRMASGDQATKISEKDGWVRVQFNGEGGWVASQYVSANTSQKSTASKTKDTFTVAVDALNVRSKPNQESKKLGQIYQNEAYRVLEQSGNWLKLNLSGSSTGWVYSFHGHLSNNLTIGNTSKNTVTVLTNGTNIRQQASTSSAVLQTADAGQVLPIISTEGEWFKVQLSNGKQGYLANWVVKAKKQEVTTTKKARTAGTLQGVTVVIDPGHGGRDRGTTGAKGTPEKEVTLPTAELLATKLQAAGAKVHLTRESDKYISLRKRVETSHQQEADVFISLHYDASLDPSISGFTTFYAVEQHKSLANAVHDGISQQVQNTNRGVQFGNFFVLRENRRPSILVELGFLTNQAEEQILRSASFKEQATQGIYTGLLRHFNQ